ncbi:helix-turn-helix domain-containing protein [Microvirga makkahensis]|uniref:Helix-turn-helix domain-containing protein n=1 Tax=Microvirga makkahensis TaxID=1128670 RepID=A0A7X3MR67_9HYPH|nr:helix-turn-helix domain-containing protein [Microvirga makkahensis]
MSYIHALRITMARHLLEDGRQTIQTGGQAVGYEDRTFFRGLFKRHTGVCPTAYRTRFGNLPIASRAADRHSREAGS